MIIDEVERIPEEGEIFDITKGLFAEQVIRPTGLVDPECIIRPASTQVDDLLEECKKVVNSGKRVLVTTLTRYPGYCTIRVYNATAVLQFLIDEGANLEAVDKNGWTALHLAAESDKKEAAEILRYRFVQ